MRFESNLSLALISSVFTIVSMLSLSSTSALVSDSVVELKKLDAIVEPFDAPRSVEPSPQWRQLQPIVNELRTKLSDRGWSVTLEKKHLDATGRITFKVRRLLLGLDGLRGLRLRDAPLTPEGAGQLDALTTLESLDLAGTRIDSAGLKRIARLKRLRILDLSSTATTDEGIAHLKSLRGLSVLSLYGTEITDAGLVHIAALNQLTVLDLEFCGNLTNAGLSHLKNLTNLRALSLKQTAFEDEIFDASGLMHVSGLTGLEILVLYGTKTTDDALIHLKQLKKLRELDLSLTHVTDAGLVHLQSLDELSNLNLTYHQGFVGATITSAGVEPLLKLVSLETLNLTGAKISSADVARLKTLTKLKSLRWGEPTVASAPTSISTRRDAHWPQWRGPQRDAMSRETGLRRNWQPDPPALVWSASKIGDGYASVVVSNGRTCTLGKLPDSSVVVTALDDASGAQLWQTVLGVSERNAMGTPTIDGDRVYALSPDGELFCLNATTGESFWKLHFVEDLSGKPQSGRGYAESPLIDGDRLICTPGGPDATIVALDKRTGEETWRSSVPNLGEHGRDGASFASPALTKVGGVRVCVQFLGRGLVGVNADTGAFLWGYNRVANTTANISSPVVRGEFVFGSSGYSTGAALVEQIPDGNGGVSGEERYFLNAGRFQNHHGGMILVGDYVYGGHGSNNGLPTCIELTTGRIVWKSRGPGTGSASVVYADGHLYFRYQDGVMALIEATPDGYKLKGTFNIPGAGGDSWAHPVVAGARLYLREKDNLLVYDIAAR